MTGKPEAGCAAGDVIKIAAAQPDRDETIGTIFGKYRRCADALFPSLGIDHLHLEARCMRSGRELLGSDSRQTLERQTCV